MTTQRLRKWLRSCPPFFDEHAQDAIEYLLVVGVLVVALTLALTLGFEALVPQVVAHICPSVDTGTNPVSTVGACISQF